MRRAESWLRAASSSSSRSRRVGLCGTGSPTFWICWPSQARGSSSAVTNSSRRVGRSGFHDRVQAALEVDRVRQLRACLYQAARTADMMLPYGTLCDTYGTPRTSRGPWPVRPQLTLK